jgi:hypothetical protein
MKYVGSSKLDITTPMTRSSEMNRTQGHLPNKPSSICVSTAYTDLSSDLVKRISPVSQFESNSIVHSAATQKRESNIESYAIAATPNKLIWQPLEIILLIENEHSETMKAPQEIEIVPSILRQSPTEIKSNDDSVSSEISLDLLVKEQAEENDDSRQSQSSSSVTSCRWNPDDSDYSLNVLLPPKREVSPVPDEEQQPQITSRQKRNSANGESLSAASTHTMFSDYSLNRMRVRPSSKRLLDASSTHSTLSVDTFDTSDFSLRSKLPESIEVHKPKKSENNVRFYPRVRIQRVMPRKKMPKEQMHAVWYSRDEFHAIRQECFKTIRLMKDDEDAKDFQCPFFDDEDNELCRRGLEYKTPKAYKRRQKQKKDVRLVVFEELDFQEEQGMNDPLWVAKLSRDQSRPCVEAAIETAKEDERQARLYLDLV